MKKTILAIVLFSSISLYAVTKADIDKVEQDVNYLDRVVTNHYKIIRANRVESVESILKRYSGAKALLINRWFSIVTQSSNESSTLLRFLLSSNCKIKFYLEQMLLDNKHPMSQKDYELITQKIMSFGKNKYDGSDSLDYRYITTTGVNLRSLPIFVKLTKYMVLKEKTKLRLIYDISYKTESGKMSRWGFFKVESSGQRGWINLKNIRRVK
jgi:hypothetical protein